MDFNVGTDFILIVIVLSIQSITYYQNYHARTKKTYIKQFCLEQLFFTTVAACIKQP